MAREGSHEFVVLTYPLRDPLFVLLFSVSSSFFLRYMAHGGTNFGFWSGANGDLTSEGKQSFKPDVTSYDYSSPISEAGDHNIGSSGGDLFAAVQTAINASSGTSSGNLPVFPAEPAPISKKAYGEVRLDEAAPLLDNLDDLAGCHVAVPSNAAAFPSMEDLQSWYGFVLFQTAKSTASDATSGFPSMTMNFSSLTLHDRVQVFVDGAEAGTAYRATCPSTVQVPAGKEMGLLVENMGRINYGTAVVDHKGLFVTPPVQHIDWTATCLPLQPEQVQGLPFKSVDAVEVAAIASVPTFLRGYLQVQGVPLDTFLDTRGLTKGT